MNTNGQYLALELFDDTLQGVYLCTPEELSDRQAYAAERGFNRLTLRWATPLDTELISPNQDPQS